MSNVTDNLKSTADTARRLVGQGAQSSARAFDAAVLQAAKMNKRTLGWIGIALAAVTLLSVNLIAGTAFRSWQTDVTEDSLYTITDRTKRVLSRIEEPLDIKVYYTTSLGDQAPQISSYFRRIRALLERYRDLSGGRIKLEFINPLPFSDAEDRAVVAGLRGVRMNNQGDQAYFGLVATNSTDDVEAVPFFSVDREQFLEYDLTKIVHTLANPKKKVIGLITSLTMQGMQNPMTRQGLPPWMVLKQIAEFYEVRSLGTNPESIDTDIDTLLIVAPNNLTARGAYAVDQFALRGGRILAFVDPVPEVGKMLSMGKKLGDGSNFTKLLNTWGVIYDPQKVAIDIDNARRVQVSADNRPVITEYVAWLTLNKSALDADDPLSGSVEQLNLATPGFIDHVKGAATSFVPILKTSANASTADASKFEDRPDALGLLRAYKPGAKPLVLAARVTGPIKTAFPNGQPKEDPADKEKNAEEEAMELPKEPKPPAKPMSEGKLNAIVITDSDMLHDRFWVDVSNFLGQQIQIPNSHNVTLLLNALENLSGGEALAGLGARGVKDRPFEYVNNIRRSAEREFREKEETLVAKLKATEAKLADLEKKSAGGQVILSEKDKETIEQFRVEMLTTRRELRKVKHDMRKDIDNLDTWLQFANIGAIPLLIGAGAVGMGLLRRRRRKSN